jgi:hypothetical protein
VSETILELPQSQAPVQVKPRTIHRFTSENARLNAAKSWQARRQAEQDREAALQEASKAEPEADPFHSRTLARVRVQVSRLLSLMVSEDDGPKLERLAGAIAKLEEIERRLSDRSLPAVRRVQDRPGSSSSRSAALLLSKPSSVPVQRQEQE